MTKNELMEDVNIGDIVKIHTESGEVFDCKIITFGESGLKVSMLSSNKSKRIMYERIIEVEYDSDKNKDNSETDAENGRLEDSVDNKNIVEEKKRFSLDRSTIFNKWDLNIDLDIIKEEWVNKLDSKQKNEYIRIANSLDYAKKVHEYSLDSERVTTAIENFKNAAADINNLNVFIALIYHGFNDIKTAIDYYGKAGAYDLAFLLSLKYGYNNMLFDKAVLAIEHNDRNETIIKWLCEYAVNNNDFSVIKYVIDHCKNDTEKVLLFWYADKPEIESIPDKKDIFATENTIYLKNLNTETNRENETHIKTILENEPIRLNKPIISKSIDENRVYQGTISYYNKNGGNGMIKNLEGGSVYFFIKQVKDLELQRILTTETNYKRKVSFTKGINFKGELAADSIELLKTDLNEPQETEYRYEGFFDNYDFFKKWGRISVNNKFFNFVFEEIKDPLLYAEIKSRPYYVITTPVKFNVRKYVSKRTKKMSWIAIDICGAKEYSQEEIEAFISQNYVTKKEVNEWLGIEEESDTSLFSPIVYEPLAGVKKAVKTETHNKQQEEKSFSENKKDVLELRKNEKEAVSILLSESNENPFLGLKKDTSGKKYFQQAHKYMTGMKGTNGHIVGINLEKAEEYFIKSIEAGEQVDSAVANLTNNVYIQMGGEYISKGLYLLDLYGHLFSEDKLTDMRIQLIDKSGNLDALELIYQSAIPRVNKKTKKLHYMSKLAGLYFKRKQWEMAIQWFNESISYLNNNKNEFPQYVLLKKGILRPLIISHYNAGNIEKANEQALKYIELNPYDAVIKSIIDGAYKPNDDEEILEELSELIDENIDVTHINQYIQNHIEEMNLDSEVKVKGLLEDGVFVGSQNIAASILKSILKGTSVNEEAKGNQYLAGAKLIRQILNRNEEIDMEKFNEQRYLFFVAEGTCSYANSRLYRKESMNNLDVARYFYMQPIMAFNESQKFRISWAVATIRYIQTYFETIDEIRQFASRIDQRYKDFDSCDNAIEKIMQKPLVDVQGFIVGMIELLLYNTRIKKNVLRYMFAGNDSNSILDDLKTFLDINVIEINNNIDDIERLWDKVTEKYYAIRKQFLRLLKETIDSLFVVGQLQTFLDEIQKNNAINWLSKTDKAYIDKLITIIKDIVRYHEISEFDYKAEKLRSVYQACQSLQEIITEYPTYFAYEKVLDLLKHMQELIMSESSVLYTNSEPKLTVSLSGDSSVEEVEKLIRVPIAFTNKPNVQDADNVQISILGEGIEVINDTQLSKGILRGDGRAREELVTLKLSDNIMRNHEFSIEINVKYQYHISMIDTKKVTDRFVLSIPLYSSFKFKEIKNRFEEYKSGSEVKDASMFYGRDKDIENILAQISGEQGKIPQGRCLALYGQTRTGKSSLLYHIEKKLRELSLERNIIVNIGSIGEQDLSNDDITDFLYAILEGIKYEIDTNHKKLSQALKDFGIILDADKLLEDREHSQSLFNKEMTSLSRLLKQQSEQYSLILMIDEFTYIYDWIRRGSMTEHIMEFWKGFVQKHEIFAIIIGQDHMKRFVEEDTRFTNAFGSTDLKKITYLAEEDAKKLMYEPIIFENDKHEKINRYKEDALDRLFELTSGSAYLIMILCAGLVDYLNEIHSAYISKAHIDDYLRKNLASFDERIFEPQYNDKSEVEPDKITKSVEQNKKILLRIAQLSNKKEWTPLQNVIQSEEDKKTIESLQLRDVVIVENNDRCKIKVALYKEWLLEKFGIGGSI